MGLTLIDPHGTTEEALEKLVPEKAIEHTWTLRLVDRDWVPCMNLFCHEDLENLPVTQLALEAVEIIRSLFPNRAWGPDIHNQLLRLVESLIVCRGRISLLEGYFTFDRDRKGEKIIAEMFPFLDDYPHLKRWWKKESKEISRDGARRAQKKLLPLLTTDPFRYMFAQREDKYNIRRIVSRDENLLANVTGGLAVGVTQIACRVLLTRLHFAAWARLQTDPSSHKPYEVLLEEAQYACGEAFSLKDMIRTWRKVRFRLSTIVHTRRILPEADQQALGEVGSSGTFGCTPDEAREQLPELRGRVEAKDLVHRRVGEGYLRLGEDIGSFAAPPPPSHGSKEIAEAIRERSRRELCIPLKEAKERERELWGDDLPALKRGLGEYDRW